MSVWIENGAVMPWLLRVPTMSAGTPRSAKVTSSVTGASVARVGAVMVMVVQTPIGSGEQVSRGLMEKPETKTRTCVAPDVMGAGGPESRRETISTLAVRLRGAKQRRRKAE